MSKIAGLTGHKDQMENYTKIAHEYLDFWTIHGINSQADPKHTVLQYDSPDTYGKPPALSPFAKQGCQFGF